MKKHPVCNLFDREACPRNSVFDILQNHKNIGKISDIDIKNAVSNCEDYWNQLRAHNPIFCPYWDEQYK